MKHWLFITRPEFWEILMPPNSRWMYRRAYDEINIGDRAIVLVSRLTVFSAALEVTGHFRNRGGLSAFPLVTDINYLVTLEPEKYISVKEHKDNLDIFKGKSPKGWGATLQKSKINISKSDYDYVHNLLIEQGSNV